MLPVHIVATDAESSVISSFSVMGTISHILIMAQKGLSASVRLVP